MIRRFIVLFIILDGLISPSLSAERVYCPLPEHGNWLNRKASAKQLKRLEIKTNCLNGQVIIKIRAYTSCIPRDCKWGWTKGTLMSDGKLRVILAGFFGRKQIDLKAVGSRMEAYLTNDPYDPILKDSVESYTLYKD